uniref:DUF19 domain-containing protein n=1 Tax=Syphacia muris TaxID=451379 RepID=A0A0N5ATJ8_9BILA
MFQYICKSSTVPECLKLSSNDSGQVFHSYTGKEIEHGSCPNEVSTKLMSSALRCRTDTTDKEHIKMNSSFASDSGCMMESGSSIATTEDERKNFSLEDMTVVSGCCCEMLIQENCATNAFSELILLNVKQ